MTVRRNLNRKSAHKSSRRTQHETLERRELLAAELGALSDGPRLISVSANSGEVFDLQDNNILSTPPTELKFRFGGELIDQATLAGIEFRRPGDNGVFEASDDPASDDVIVQPGFLGFEDNDGTNIIVARFAETLPDDQYIIRLAGYDDTNSQIVGLRNVDGDLFCATNPLDPNAPIQDVRFEVEVGPRVVAVVPQPVEVVNGSRIQRRDQVFVYFNDDPLSNPLAGPISSSTSSLPVVQAQFYKLIYTNNTVENTDDDVIIPINVEYDPALNLARLTFQQDLSELAPAAANDNSGTYRLRIGRGDALPLPPTTVTSPTGGDDTFATAEPLGVAFGSGTQSVVVTEGLIQSTNAIIPDWPGAYDAPGLRHNRRDVHQTGQDDTNVGINVFPYNFARVYGRNPQQIVQENAITEAQKQRVREVLDLYSERLGVEFVETNDKGLQIVTGDLRAVVITADTGAGADTPLSIYRVNERDQTQGLLILDAGENFFDGYGLSPDNRPSFFVEVVRGIGDLLGIGDMFELPAGNGAGGTSPDEPDALVFSEQFYPNLPIEPEFLSQSDVTVGQGLHRPESNDVDFYSFSATETGVLAAETIAERLDGSSLLDTNLNLYRVVDAAADEYELIARNDDFYSEDSFIGVEIEPGDYIIGVSASGNENYNGQIADSGLGGTSEGRYELRLTFKSSDGSTILDTTGTQLDGDADGQAGGEFNFWFRVARDLSTAATNQPKTIFVDKFGDDLNDGSLSAPKRTISAAFGIANEGDIVRLLPNTGADGLLSTEADNLAYEIGLSGPQNNQPLDDGAEFEVPKGVAVMVDAGAIFKLVRAKISVGSESIDEDRSLASLQVMGTPVIVNADGSTGSGEVYFTSYEDTTIGFNTNPLAAGGAPGQWAGIEYRNDFDYSEGRPVWESEGIFLDYVSHANMQYGGGSISVDRPVVTPIRMAESRPTLIYNTIRNSADAAISADPNSFLETNFHAPIFQRGASFTSDYDRVGPEISGNTLIDNSINGLFVRVNTPAAGQLEPMTVSGRFDDTDIVHVISQVLVLQGGPGGAILLEDRPDVLSVTATPTTPPQPSDTPLAPLTTYFYRVSYVTSDGVETLASLPTSGAMTSVGALLLDDLPTTPNQFAGRRLYRSDSLGGDYTFVTQLDRGTTTYLDDGTTRGGLLRSEQRPDSSGIALSDGDGGVLTAGLGYDYRLTFVNTVDGQSQASLPSATRIAPVNGSIRLDNLPTTPEGFVGRRLYRLIPATGEYQLVANLDADSTSYVDDGRSEFSNDPILDNDGDNGALFMPRFDARLSVDPGLIVKLQSARIEARFGADFYAEGADGQEIIFTSRRDDTYGAGGTFDTNNDNIRDNAAPGDWGGLIFRQDTTGSLDFAEVRYGGGETAINGAFTDFNAIEIVQADVRIANSTIRDNADGFNTTSIRGGAGFNVPAAIFVRGSQPILLENTIEGNEGAAISINPDALTHDPLLDYGRSTGNISTIFTEQDNQGPLIVGNQLNRNTINGLDVRSEVLTTDSVWDDTDIVHVVQGQIISFTHHFRGGLRLESDPGQNLVVKFGPGGQLIGGGRPLDIDDRIGGTLQVMGTPGNPVILTSLLDDTVGAGFTPEGRPTNNTLDAGSGNPQAGDWLGLLLDTFVNDRNVAYVLENEPAIPAAIEDNSSATNSQLIGDLAAHEYAGDETERLGFNIRGTLAVPEDIDVYKFTATGGTGVYFDIDDTSVGLDTVVELVDVNDVVLASSDNSFFEATNPSLLGSTLPVGTVQPLYQLGVGNVESPNPLDAGMRVILDGSNTEENEYYVRVRSANGKSAGQYQLSIRLRETEEVAGSIIQFADIRYATDAITVSSAPLHSPLAGDGNESLDFNTIVDPTPGNPQSGDEFVQESDNVGLSWDPANADQLGNLATSDRGSLVVTGELGNINSFVADVRLEDIDVYQVDLFSQQIEPDVFDDERRFITTTFDIDYADGLGRPNTSISVFDSGGRLVLHSRDSNVADDRGRPLQDIDTENLSGGSAGTLDAYIGPVEMPEGTYFVVVSNAATVPSDLGQFFDPGAANTNVRLMPINSVRRIADDSLDDYFIPSEGDLFPITFTDDEFNYTAERPIIEPVFDADSLVPYRLDDIRLFVSLDTGISGNNRSTLASFNPFTGTMERLIGQSADPTADIATRIDGKLFSSTLGPNQGARNNGNTGSLINLSPIDGAIAANSQGGDDVVTFFRSNQNFNGTETVNTLVMHNNAIAFPLADGVNVTATQPLANNNPGFLIGERQDNGRGGEIPDELTRNLLYSFRTHSGEIDNRGVLGNNSDRTFPNGVPYIPAFGPASSRFEYGVVDTGFIYDTGGDGGDIHGLAIDPDDSFTFFGATDQGGIHSFSRFDNIDAPVGSPAEGYGSVIPTVFHGVVPIDPEHQASSFTTVPQFSGLAFGPRTIEDGELRRVLFMTTSDGWLYAAEIDGNDQLQPANVFYNGRSAIPLSFQGDTGFFFGSTLGAPVTGLAFSPLEESPWHQTGDRNLDDGHGIKETFDRSREEFASRGGNSLYYGFEITANIADNTIQRADDSPLTELAPGGSHGSVISRPFNLEGYSSADKPTLYFSYFMEVEAQDDYFPIAPNPRNQNDSFRVFGAGDDGEWKLLATNDDFRELPFADEYDYFNETNIPVQELFDDDGNWRQARVDISPLAGSENARIRFDFSTAGSMRTHFGSIDLVGTNGDEIGDHQQVIFDDEDGNQIVLENIVGRDLIFPSGADLNIGDSFTATGPDGTVAMQFVDTVPIDDSQIQFNPSMTAADVANAVVEALPQTLSPFHDGNGRVSLFGASDVGVLGDAPIGQSNPVLVQRLEDPNQFFFGDPSPLGANQVVIPDGNEISPGDQIEVILGSTFFPTVLTTLTFVEVSTGAPGEIVFDRTESAETIAERVVAAMPQIVQAIDEGNGVITLLNDQAGVQLISGPSTVVATDPFNVDEGRVLITPADGDNLIDGETLTFKYANGTTTVTFIDRAPFFVNFPGFVTFQGGDTVATIAQRLRDALPADLAAHLDGNTTVSVAASVTSEVPADSIGIGPSPTRRITIPDGNNLTTGETLLISDDNGVIELTFEESSIPGPPGTVNYLSTDTADVIASRVATVLGTNYDVIVDVADVLIFGAVSVTTTPGSNILQVTESGQEIIVPSGFQLVDGQTLDIVTFLGTTTITFVNGPAVNPGDVSFSAFDPPVTIAGNLATELTNLGFSAVVDTVTGNTVRLLADDVISGTANTNSTLLLDQLATGLLNLSIPDGSEIRSGTQITLFGPTFETITFIRRGENVPDVGTIPVYYTNADTAEDLYPAIIGGLSAAWDAYVDPSGNGINILFPGVFASVTNGPSAIQQTGREVNETAIPITLPSGNLINEGESITITSKDDVTGANNQTFTFVTALTSTGAPNEILYDTAFTAAEMADALLTQLPLDLQAYLVGSREVHLLNAQSVATAAGSSIISYRATTPAEIPIIVDNTMTTREVTERLRIGLTEGFSRFVPSDNNATSSDVYKVYGGDRIRLYNATPTDQGPYGISSYLVGGNGFPTSAVPADEFGEDQPAFIGTSQIRQQGALNNDVEGVYIDDIIIGFAERGEMVVEGSTNSTDFIFNPETLPDTHPLAIQPERQNEALLGPYSLEIRTADNYGVEQDYFPINLPLGEQGSLGRSFDTNDRLADGAVTLVTPAGDAITDGATFVLNDGWRQITFEFDSIRDGNVVQGNVPVSFDPSSPRAELVARSVRDAINSAQAQNVLAITAATSDGFESAANTGNRVELFGSDISVNPAGGRFIKMDLVAAETSQGRETSRQIPISFQDEEAVVDVIFGDELARSTPSGYFDATVDTLVGIGKIGDTVVTGTGVDNLQDGAVVLNSSPELDFDSVRIYLHAGQTVDIDVDTLGFSKAGEILDLPVITVFDAGEELTGQLLGFTIDRARQSSLFEGSRANGEHADGAFLAFTAPTDGYYDVVVSTANLFGNTFIEVPTFATAFFYDGTTFDVNAGPSQVTYEYTTNPNLVTVNTPILLTVADGPEEIAAATAAAIRANQSDVLIPTVDGRFVNLQDFGFLPSFGFNSFNSVQFRDVDFGEYALTVRPPASTGNVPASDVLMVDYQFGITDENRVKDQGQLIISSNFIADSSNTGVRAVSGQRGETLANNAFPPSGAIFTPSSGNLGPDGIPRPGSARLLRNQNTDDLIPGVVISNNVIANSGQVGIEFGGDVNIPGQIEAPAAFGRIVNNTIFNQGSGDGVRVSGNASPTILNNIFNGFNNGLIASANQAGDIITGGNAYRLNNTDSTIGLANSSFVVPDPIALFEDETRGIFIPADNSDVIDSSFDTLPDRDEFFDTVKEPAGIAPSPIVAPNFDAYGQARVDDPDVQTPGGVGLNVFIDRGAIDRADFVRPTAALTGPQDSIGFQVPGGDQDIDSSFVRLIEGTVEFFEVQLSDPSGTGIDPQTVTSESVILTENGERLTPDVDYVFGYSSNSQTIRLTPLTGIWRPDAVYEITLNNQQRIELNLPSGNLISDGDQVIISDLAGNPTTFEFDSGFSLVIPQTSTLTVGETNAGFGDGQLITITSPTGVIRSLEFDFNNATGGGNIPVNLSAAGTIQQVRNAILTALQSIDPGSSPAVTVAEALDLAPIPLSGNAIQLGTLAGHTVTTNAGAVTIGGQPGGVVDGDGFTYTTGTETVTFELTTDLGVSDPSFVPISFTRTDTPDQIAAAIAAAVVQEALGLTSAQAVGGGRVVLGGLAADVLTVNGAGITADGAPGVSPGATAVPFLPSSQVTPALVASSLQNAVNQSGSTVRTFNPGGGTLLLSNASNVQSDFGGTLVNIGQGIPAVSDLAGNRVRETRLTNETRFTIIMPEVVFDYGDAPDSLNTILRSNGARHTISGDSAVRLGRFLDSEVDGQPVNGDDTPLTINGSETGVIFDVPPSQANELTIVVSSAPPVGGETLTLTIGSSTKVFELIRSTSNPTSGNIPITFTNGEQPDSIARKVLDAIRANFPAIDEAILPTFDAAGTSLTLTAIDDEDGVSIRSYTHLGRTFQVFVDPSTPPDQIVTADDVVGFLNPRDPAGTQMPIFITGSGILEIWIDSDFTNTFENTEKVFSQPVVGGQQTINIPQLEDIGDGEAWMRVRLSPSGGLTHQGVAVGGEVEDYLVSIVPEDLPTPADDPFYVVNEDTTLVVNAVSTFDGLRANDGNTTNLLGLENRVVVGDLPQNGTLTIDDDVQGYFTYVPDPDFYGIDTFTYRLTTQFNSGASAAGSTFVTATISVLPINDSPGFENGSLPKQFVTLEVNSQQPDSLTIDRADLLSNTLGHANPAIGSLPFDESTQTIRVVAVTAGGLTIRKINENDVATTDHGTITATFDPATDELLTVVYTPNDDFNSDNLPLSDGSPRLDGFTFTIQDDDFHEPVPGLVVPSRPVAELTAEGSVEIRVTPQNNPPTPITETVSIEDASYNAFFVNQGQTPPVPTEDQQLIIPSAYLLQNDFIGTPGAEDENTFVRNNDGSLRIVGASMDPDDGEIQVLSTGDLLLLPADDVYGQITFSYVVEDQGIDEATDGTRTLNRLTGTVQSTIFLEPVNDAPVAYDRFLEVQEAVEPAGPAVLPFTAADLLNGAGPNLNSPIIVGTNQITLPDGSQLIDGETFTITDTSGLKRVVELSTSTTASVGTDLLVTYALGETADQIAARLETVLRADGAGGIANGATVSFINISAINSSTFQSTVSATDIGISIPDGATIISGETVTTTDSGANDFVIEFNTTGVSRGNADVVIPFSPTSDPQSIALLVQAALVNRGYGASEMSAFGNRWMINFTELTVAGINDPNSMIGVSADILTLPDGNNLINGETINLSTGQGNQIVVEFNTTGTPAAGTDLVVQYALTDLGPQIATNLQDALRTLNHGAIATGADVQLTSIVDASSAPPATNVVTTQTTIDLPVGSELIDGETIDLVTSLGTSVIELNTTGVASPGSDYVIQYSAADAPATLAAAVRDALRVDGFAVSSVDGQVVFSNPDTIVPGELPAVAGDFADDLSSDFNETEQSLRVVAFTTSEGTVDVANVGNGTTTLATSIGGTLSLTFAAGGFVSGTYTPPIDFNELPPFVPRDLFTYTIADDGRTTLPVSGTIEDLPDERSLRPATVTITVTPANDPPTFDLLPTLDILEDSNGIVVPNVITNALPGPPTASDELNDQTVSFEIVDALSTVPAGLMTQSPDIDPTTLALTLYPAPDAVGTAVYVVRAEDDGPGMRTTDKTITVNVRPVNDAPRFINIAPNGIGDTADTDTAYRVDGANGNLGEITYRLREDNTQPLGATEPYRINLNRPTGVVGYNAIGLLDVFTVGPANEANGSPGGGQVLELFSFPATTDLGGQLTSVFEGGQLVALEYTPPLNYNSTIGGPDSFTYTVRDGNPNTGETYSLAAGALVPDRLTTSNTVMLDLTPVNDRPEFDLATNEIEVIEDGAPVALDVFATNINAGPPATAFDEVDIVNGQSVRFSVTSLGFPESQASQFFTQFPAITPEGRLTYQPAPNVFGQFVFEVVLTDDGPGNATRGDLISSFPELLTINVRPVNDPPVIAQGSDPLEFTLLEDGTVDILINGDTVTPGLLDSFLPGPNNESGPIVPGGNQSVSLTDPIPQATAEGGTLEPISDATGLVRLRYRPRENFTGTDSFIYTVTDDGVSVQIGSGGTPVSDPRIASNTVTLEVLPVNDAPQFSGAANVVSQEDAGPVSISGWATNVQAGPSSASDENGVQNLQFQITQTSSNPELFSSPPIAIINGSSATLSYQSAPDANGTATFVVRLIDDGPTDAGQGDDNISDPRTFTIRVNSINDPPSYTQGGTVTVNEDSGPYGEIWATSISPGPADEAGQSVLFEVTTPPAVQDLFQSLPEISDAGILRFIPASNANGIADVQVVAVDSADGRSEAVTLRIIINEVNDTPIAVADEFSTDEDTPLVITSAQLLSNDIDPDLMTNPLESLQVIMPATSVSVSGAQVTFDAATGTLTYDPTNAIPLQALAPGQIATDTIRYSVRDASGATSFPITVTLNVDGVNDAPVARDDNPTLSSDGPTTVIPVLQNDFDVDGIIDPRSIEITFDPGFGSLDISPTGVITFTAFQAFAEVDQFRYTIADDLGLRSAEATVTISANAAPISFDDRALTFLDEAIEIPVLTNDSDPNGQLDPQGIEIVTPPLHGQAIPRGDGTVRYIPGIGFLGFDRFEYRVADNEGRFGNAATVDVQVVESRLHNPDEDADVNDDGNVTAIDALLVINRLSRADSDSIPVLSTDVGPFYYDTSGDQIISVRDASIVITELARRNAASIEGEQVAPSDSLGLLGTTRVSTLDSFDDPAPVADTSEELAPMDKVTGDKVTGNASSTDDADAVISLIANDRDDEDDSDARVEALDAAFSDLI